MRRYAMYFLAGLVLAAGLSPTPALAIKAGDPVPEFSLKSESGKQVTQESLVGKKTIITFLQSACSACKGEIVLLSELSKKNKDVQVLPVSVDAPEAAAMLQRFKTSNAVTFDFLLDPGFTLPGKFGFSFTPAAVIVGKDGKIEELLPGYNDDSIKKLKAQF